MGPLVTQALKLMEQYGLRLRPEELFGHEPGQPGKDLRRSKAHLAKIAGLKARIMAELLPVPKEVRYKAVRAAAEKYQVNRHTIHSWLRVAEKGCR